MAKEKTFNAIFGDMIANINRNRSKIEGGDEFATFLCDALERLRPHIEEEYVYLNRRTKRKYMRDIYGPLDRHKCAAAFMIAFLEVFNLGRDAEKLVAADNRLIHVRERLALVVGFSVMTTLIYEKLAELREKGDEPEKLNEYEKFTNSLKGKNNDFTFPPKICDDHSYIHNWLLDLYYSRKEGRLFVLPLANELYWIEAYNRQLAGC